MLNVIVKNPTSVYFGDGMEDLCGQLISEYSHKILLVYGGGSIKQSGLFDKVVKDLSSFQIEYHELGGIMPNPRLDLVHKGIDICREHALDFILAIGGGSVIDTAKAIACGVPNLEDDVWDYFLHTKKPEKILPVGTILTLPAAGSESSDAVVITKAETKEKLAYNDNRARPVFSILNPRLTCSVPAYHTSCGIVDAMAHVFERYFTNTQYVDVTDRLCEAALRSLMKYGPLVLEEPDNYDYRAEVMWACKLGNDGSFGVGRQPDWASHFIEQELSAWRDVAHGAGLAVVFPAWMEYVFPVNPDRFLQFVTRVMSVDLDYADKERTILQGIKKLKEFFKSLGMPITLREMGFEESELAPMAEKCAKSYGGHVGAFKKLDAEDIEKIYRIAY